MLLHIVRGVIIIVLMSEGHTKTILILFPEIYMFIKKLIFSAALLICSALFLTACGSPEPAAAPAQDTDLPQTESPAQPDFVKPADPVHTPAATEDPDLPIPVAPGFAEGDDMPAVTRTPVEPEPDETEPPDSAGGPDVPAQATPADDSYFDDAAFIGNSLMDGFRLYSGLTNCDVYAKTSMTVLGVGDYITQMSSLEYGKIYILLGINEIGYDDETFKELYADMLDRIIADHPEATIYIMGLSPVSKAKSDSHEFFNMERIHLYNERLYELAGEKDCYYIDLCDALMGEDGYLPAEVTFDGIHFTAEEYGVWLDYLRIHYIP